MAAASPYVTTRSQSHSLHLRSYEFQTSSLFQQNLSIAAVRLQSKTDHENFIIEICCTVVHRWCSDSIDESPCDCKELHGSCASKSTTSNKSRRSWSQWRSAAVASLLTYKVDLNNRPWLVKRAEYGLKTVLCTFVRADVRT
jgi:hypothetical protein